MKRIKALLTFARTAPQELVMFARGVLTRLYREPAYPNPPVEMSLFAAAIDRLETLNTKAMDGSKKVFAELKAQVQIVVEMLRQLAHYVEAASNGDMETFLSSGFNPAPTKRTQTPPLTKAIRKIVPGSISGQALVTLVCDPDAYAYQLRWTQRGSEAIEDAWATKPVGNTRPPTLIEDLMPGTMYVFQVRSVRRFDTSDWSDPVRYICT